MSVEEKQRRPTFGVLQHPLNQHRVLRDPLGHQQDAFWDAEPPHNTAAHLFLEEDEQKVDQRNVPTQQVE